MMKSTVDKEWNGDIIKIQGNKVVGKSAFEIGLIVEAQAKYLVPVDYGYLRASITTQSISQGTELEVPKGDSTKHAVGVYHESPKFEKISKPSSENEVLVGTVVEYAPYIEFGTVKMDAQPFLRPALDLAKGKTLTIVRDNAKYIFGDYLKKAP